MTKTSEPTDAVVLADPAAALPGTQPGQPALDGNNLAAISGRFTQFVGELRGLLLNDCLRFQTVLFDANGQADMNQFADVPYAGLAVWNIGTGAVTVEAGPPQGLAPLQGIGVMRIPAGGSAGWPSTGTTLSMYGTAGQPVAVALYAKSIQPFASGGGSAGATYPTIIPADGTANPAAAILEAESFGMIWNGATWDRAKSPQAVGDAGNWPGVGAVGIYLRDPGNVNVADRLWAWGQLGSGPGTMQAAQPSSTPSTQTSVANSANTITIAPGGGGSLYRLTFLSVSWSGAAATTGTLTITSNGVNMLVIDIPLALNTPFQLALPAGGLAMTVSQNLVATIAAGGVGAISKLTLGYVPA